jgi:hypothetical protein
MTSGAFDRRNFRRTGVGEHGIISARVRPGHPVAVIDISAGGVLIEISRLLLPGAAADLQLDTAHRRASLRGRVLRCAVCRLLPSGVSYRAAIVFDRQWPFSPRAGGVSIPFPPVKSSPRRRSG